MSKIGPTINEPRNKREGKRGRERKREHWLTFISEEKWGPEWQNQKKLINLTQVSNEKIKWFKERHKRGEKTENQQQKWKKLIKSENLKKTGRHLRTEFGEEFIQKWRKKIRTEIRTEIRKQIDLKKKWDLGRKDIFSLKTDQSNQRQSPKVTKQSRVNQMSIRTGIDLKSDCQQIENISCPTQAHARSHHRLAPTSGH